MAENNDKNNQNEKSGKSNFEYLLVALFIVAIVITIVNLFQWPSMENDAVYGQSLEKKIQALRVSIRDLEKRVDSLSSSNLALFILVFISLAINIIFVITRFISKNRKNDTT